MLTLTDLLIPTYRNMLRTLRGLIDKAEAQLRPDKPDARSPPVSRSTSRLNS